MYFVFIYENRNMKAFEIVLRRREGAREKSGGVNLRYIVSTYVNIKNFITKILMLYNYYVLFKIKINKNLHTKNKKTITYAKAA
jgi:hypothetical protein